MTTRKGKTRYQGDLARLTALGAAALAFFGALLLAIIAYAGWSANQTAYERESMLVENAMNQSIARTLNEQKSVAWWDDAVTNITDKKIDFDFVDANFGVFLTETYNQNEVYILNAHNEPVYAFANSARMAPNAFFKRARALSNVIEEARGGTATKLRQRPDIFGASQGSYNTLSGAVERAQWSGHIVAIDGRPAVVAALTIVPNVNMDTLKGVPHLLISVVYVDDAFVADVGRSLLLDDLGLKAIGKAAGGKVAKTFVTDDGAQVGALQWTTRRPGQVLLTTIMPLVAVGMALAGLAFSTMLRRLKQTAAELEQSEKQARHESMHDALSGLPNRASFLGKLEDRLASADEANRRVVALYFDIDRFKDINDTMGHYAGDELIRAVAERLRTHLHDGEYLARFGGDEFAVLCASTSSRIGETLSRRITQAFNTPFSIDGQNTRATVSIGLAISPKDGSTASELMRNADIALYEAKNQGRNRTISFSPDMGEKVAQKRTIEVDLRNAIENDELDLHFQPLVSTRTEKIVALEALLRWPHPNYGTMSPAVFVPVAEEAGLMPALGDWVLRRAMLAAKRWPGVELAVNLSPVQFRHADVQTQLHRFTQEYGVDPRQIMLEITEGVLLDANIRTRETLDGLRAMGFKLALDDFGTGYSSLAYLCKFKFDKLKIDKSFVTGFARGDVPHSVLKAVVTLGHGMGMSVVAEGVETEFDALAMRHFGCTELQGFFYSKPVPADAIDKLLAAQNESGARVPTLATHTG
jgi:diguanylate cyclase (GGDEF)-like protein